MADMNVLLYRSKPLTQRNDIFQLQGQLEGGFPDMLATVLGVYISGGGGFFAYGASLANNDFTIIVHLPDVGSHDLCVVPIYKDGKALYQYTSEHF
ncbi:hypothetical protein FQ192_17410 [Pseudomonas sp. ANT_J12]|uniref:hypothetical protein n=1 Tax=Pseudomonas sp. ANT_J12 TaxID=2597351 RepID=UPI0011F25055|nr:hypothetical protein [Pseudomonas sp. ANT_J12]KAA0988249.1 hypothetical protein FQ192_17410 [Pseudomonas sp. ANT_J12]